MAALAAHADELERLGIRVVVVSFCPDLQTAQMWDEEVGSPFLHLIDPSETPGHAGHAYQSWGLPKSFQGVWAPEALKFYCDEKLQGHTLHNSNGQDVHQMGGDVMINHEGIIVLRHYSKTSQDRPSMEQILTRARELAPPCWLQRLRRTKLSRFWLPLQNFLRALLFEVFRQLTSFWVERPVKSLQATECKT